MATMLMMMMVLSMATRSLAVSAEDKATAEITRRLREDYDKAIRPPSPGGTEVKLQMYFRNIDIDDVKMKANFDLTFRMLWKDPRLSYKNLPGASRIDYISLLDPSPLWLPDPFFKNGKVTPYHAIHPELYLRVFPDGNIIYSRRIALLQSCPMDLSRFPHDTQTCDVQVASYGYTTKDVIFDFSDNKSITFGQNIHADKFNFEDYNVDNCTSVTSTGDYSCIQVSMKIRRVFGTYLIQWYFPCMFLVVVAWFSFLVPGGQFLGRVLLTLVPLITLASFSNEYKKSIASVPYVCAIDTFIGISVIIIFLTLVYVILSNAQQASMKDQDENPASSPEDGEVKPAGEAAEGGFVRRLARQVKQRAEYLSRVFLIGAYVFFLFVYFVAFCGTG